MKVLNLIWGFSLGAGIDKCFLTYARLGEVDSGVEMRNVCVNILSLNSHIDPLREIGTEFIDIKSRKDFSWVGALARYIRTYQPDVVFTHGFNGAIMLLIVRVLKGVKVKTVFTYHGAYHAPTTTKKLIEPVYNGLCFWIYKHIASKTICVAEYSRGYLLANGVPGGTVVTVHNGIPDITMPASLGLTGDVVKLVTASRIDKIKGLEYLIKALFKVKKQGGKFHYYMIGEGPELEPLRQLCREMHLEHEISFVGFQSNVHEWLAASDIFVLPSLYEYHSIAVLEAMRAGKAIVATLVGGNSESIRDGDEGLLIPSRNSDALTEALIKLISDQDLRGRLAKGARARFEREFTERIMMCKIVAVLKDQR